MSDVSIASLRRMMEKAGGCQERSDKLSHELYKNRTMFFFLINLLESEKLYVIMLMLSYRLDG
jgi:hypothetical protein